MSILLQRPQRPLKMAGGIVLTMQRGLVLHECDRSRISFVQFRLLAEFEPRRTYEPVCVSRVPSQTKDATFACSSSERVDYQSTHRQSNGNADSNLNHRNSCIKHGRSNKRAWRGMVPCQLATGSRAFVIDQIRDGKSTEKAPRGCEAPWNLYVDSWMHYGNRKALSKSGI